MKLATLHAILVLLHFCQSLTPEQRATIINTFQKQNISEKNLHELKKIPPKDLIKYSSEGILISFLKIKC